MSTKQQTLKAPISFSGKGLHTGVQVTMTIHPAEAGRGIVFRRTDIEGQPEIPALCDYVVDTSRGTTIEAGGHRVSTIEHVMSALWTLGVDNALIDIDAPETPILDGSAREYARAITETGLVDQDAERNYYHVTEKMVYTIPEKGTAIILYPDDEFSVSVHVDYNSKVIGNQYATLEPGDDYASKISPCRTFVFLHELEPLMKMNLIKGGDLDNAIVVVENPVPEEQLDHLKKLFNKPDIEIIQLGGVIRHSSASVVSEYAVRMLDNFACSKLFLGVDGIDPEYGLSTTHLQEACLNRAMIASATKTVVLADSSKFGRRGFCRICGLGDIDHVITDSGTPPKMLEAMREQGIKVTVVPADEA